MCLFYLYYVYIALVFYYTFMACRKSSFVKQDTCVEGLYEGFSQFSGLGFVTLDPFHCL